jgi:hypothetical protein
MSLAMFAAPFNDNSTITLPDTDNSENILNQKRHKRTQKRYPNPKIENFDTNKVNSVLQKIHDNLDDDENEDPSAFNPPPKPQSAGVQKTIPKVESFGGRIITSDSNQTLVGKSPSPNYEGGDDLDLNDYSNYGDNKSAEEYYKRVMPGYHPGSQNIRVTSDRASTFRPYYNYGKNTSISNSQHEYPTQDVLLQKLNYMISLLEEQQDEKTNNVTEEVVLYSFLGIFIIFIADTFVRAGKYVR